MATKTVKCFVCGKDAAKTVVIRVDAKRVACITHHGIEEYAKAIEDNASFALRYGKPGTLAVG